MDHNMNQTIDLHRADPADLIGTITPTQLAWTLRRLASWGENETACAHLVLTVWTQAAIAHPDDHKGIGELQRLIQQALHPIGNRPAPPDWIRQRWTGYSDILEARRLEIVHRKPKRTSEQAGGILRAGDIFKRAA